MAPTVAFCKTLGLSLLLEGDGETYCFGANKERLSYPGLFTGREEEKNHRVIFRVFKGEQTQSLYTEEPRDG